MTGEDETVRFPASYVGVGVTMATAINTGKDTEQRKWCWCALILLNLWRCTFPELWMTWNTCWSTWERVTSWRRWVKGWGGGTRRRVFFGQAWWGHNHLHTWFHDVTRRVTLIRWRNFTHPLERASRRSSRLVKIAPFFSSASPLCFRCCRSELQLRVKSQSEMWNITCSSLVT